MASVCGKPNTEILLNSIVAGLIAEQRLPPGSLLDAGADGGMWACYWARNAPSRVVHAIDPDKGFLDDMKRSPLSRYPNLKATIALLAEVSRRDATTVKDVVLGGPDMAYFGGNRVRTRNRTASYRESVRIPVFSIDALFATQWPTEKLALAHLDVEGSELLVLRGATATILRDRPLLVTEVAVHARPENASSLLAHIGGLGYDSYLIEEITGIRADLRNILHVPRERAALLEGSNVLDVAVALRGLLAVTASTLHRHAFPCCARGAVCCPTDTHGRIRDCCSHARVHRWLKQTVAHGGADLQWFTRNTWYDQHWHTWGRVKSLLHTQQEIWARGNQSGLSYNTAPGVQMQRPKFTDSMSAEERQRAMQQLKQWKTMRDRWNAE